MRFRRDEGFTLVELMVVVLIIGILVAIAIPVFNAAKANAERKSCWANQRTLDGAARSFEAETGALPADIAAMVTADYIKTAPECPTGQDAYTWDAANGEASCTSAGHPRYDS